jgi:hypothetical protein
MEQQWNDIDGENQRTQIKTCPSATLSTTNTTWTALAANLGLHGEKLEPTNCLITCDSIYRKIKQYGLLKLFKHTNKCLIDYEISEV